ncbi:Na(+)-translocating NADH-quinone reductase subunit F [Flavobacteriaceae bacterium]|jgi:hypothetical protein|nr:Na(+)-translocating NADH-quinone reductase subunit F [Flavobacteriaceae bacterium]
MLDALDIHQLAMKEVGDHLTANGFEFLAVNSLPKKDPQFVCLKGQKLHFVVVRGYLYPENPKEFDVKLLEKVRDHGIKYKATTYYAGVGFAHAYDYELQLTQNDPYAVNFDGLQIMD